MWTKHRPHERKVNASRRVTKCIRAILGDHRRCLLLDLAGCYCHLLEFARSGPIRPPEAPTDAGHAHPHQTSFARLLEEIGESAIRRAKKIAEPPEGSVWEQVVTGRGHIVIEST